MSELLNTVAGVLGDSIIAWALLVVFMSLGFLLGRLTGGFRDMNLVTLGLVFMVIGVLSSAAGARFADTGAAVPIGLIVAALMLASFIISAALVPHRTVEVPVSDPGVPYWHPASGRFQAADHHDLREDCTNPVGRNFDIRA